MTLRFDIFRMETGGEVMWREAVETLDQAQLRVRELAESGPGEYLVMNQSTGEKIVIKPEAHDARYSPVEARYPAWESAYVAALQEDDPEKLLAKVNAAETAILARLLELNGSSNGFTERAAIKQATDALLTIKTTKLNFPDWNASRQACS